LDDAVEFSADPPNDRSNRIIRTELKSESFVEWESNCCPRGSWGRWSTGGFDGSAIGKLLNWGNNQAASEWDGEEGGVNHQSALFL
jgi:hypothetical protein